MERDEETEISADMARDKAVETLAARLYWCLEMFDPDLDDFVPWEDLTPYDRDLYEMCIRDLFSSANSLEVGVLLGGGARRQSASSD